MSNRCYRRGQTPLDIPKTCTRDSSACSFAVNKQTNLLERMISLREHRGFALLSRGSSLLRKKIISADLHLLDDKAGRMDKIPATGEEKRCTLRVQARTLPALSETGEDPSETKHGLGSFPPKRCG